MNEKSADNVRKRPLPEKYEAIADMPHHVSKKHPRMKLSDRAAQFAPFSALKGLDDEIDETGRITMEKIMLGDDALEQLDYDLAVIAADISSRPEVAVAYFVADERKAGGKYVEKTGRVKQIDSVNKTLVFDDGTTVPVGDIRRLERLDLL